MAPIVASWVRVTTAAGFEPGQEGIPNNRSHEHLVFEDPVEITQNGYIYIWVSNQSPNTKVWFDDLTVTHRQNGIVVQSTDYGVWGDVMREQKSDESVYRFGYQGQFAEMDEETGWNHFELREYDAVIGRWLVMDPNVQYWSSYMGMGNDPINMIDPDGGKGGLWGWISGIFSKNEQPEPVDQEPIILDEVIVTGEKERVKEPISFLEKFWNGSAGRTHEEGGMVVNVDAAGYGMGHFTVATGTVDGPIGPGGSLKGVYTVYKAVRKGKTVYWGITNNFVRRAREQRKRFGKIIPVFENVSKRVARGVEQIKIDTHGLRKLENMINSIRKTNPKLYEYYKDAISYLKTNPPK